MTAPFMLQMLWKEVMVGSVKINHFHNCNVDSVFELTFLCKVCGRGLLGEVDGCVENECSAASSPTA